MPEQKHTSQDFVFHKTEDGKLEFVGDFEGFYKNDDDPWGQSGGDVKWSALYSDARRRLGKTISKLCIGKLIPSSVLEIGCGLGHSLKNIKKESYGFFQWYGADISQTAVDKAKVFYPDLNFFQYDVTDIPKTEDKYDIVIFNQMLWYVLHKIDDAYTNGYSLLKKNGYLITDMAFLSDQKYGKDIVNGFDGLLKYFCNEQNTKFRIISAEINYKDKTYNDGMIVLQRI